MKSNEKKSIEIPPRGLNLRQAAEYFGVSYNTFLTMVKRGQAPVPIMIPGLYRNIWDREQLDRAMDALRDGVAA
jgi:predicted DNA-binding transcriptional regulator AlpA